MNAHDRTLSLSRRGFVLTAVAIGGGFAVGCAPKGGPSTAIFGPFVKIAEDNTVTVVAKHIEFGQGAHTGLAAIVAEELDADWSQIRIEAAPLDATRYNNLT